MDITIQSLDFCAQSFAVMDEATNACSIDALTGNMPADVRQAFTQRYRQYREAIAHVAPSADAASAERG